MKFQKRLVSLPSSPNITLMLPLNANAGVAWNLVECARVLNRLHAPRSIMYHLWLLSNRLYRGGINYMRYSVSDTAEYGDYTRGPRVIDSRVRETMKQILAEVQNGTFAKQWIAENEAGRPNFKKMREDEAKHPIEAVGKSLREMMSFLQKPKQKSAPVGAAAGVREK